MPSVEIRVRRHHLTCGFIAFPCLSWRCRCLPALTIVLAAALSAFSDEPAYAKPRIDFARDIRPILQNHCWSCHGADEKSRASGLRLDRREAATTPVGTSPPAIVPRKPDASAVMARITSTDADEVMPPPSSRKPLSEAQKRLLRDWIEEGAEYAPHWAFITPRRAPLPSPLNATWVRNPIDRFVLQRLEAEGLKPRDEAPRETLLRRVTLDLTGLPPSLEDLDSFRTDTRPDAYERAVDRLLTSPRHAERMAAQWLDVARYADTNGYNNDEERTMWPWRDWVINAFRKNMPYDQFVVEQLAGDLLPNATLDQRIATAFNRNHVLTTEGGIIEEEYRVEYVADRVHTTSTVFLGLSMQCARCHDHKYDPITQREFYRVFAYFNQLPDTGVGYNKGGFSPPFVKAPRPEQAEQLAAIERRATELDRLIADRSAAIGPVVAKWEAGLTVEDRQRIATAGAAHHFRLDESSGDAIADAVNPDRRGTIRGKVAHVEGKMAGGLEFDGQTHAELGSIGGFDAADRFAFAVWVRPGSTAPITVLSRMDDAAAFRGYDVILEGAKVAMHLVDRWPDNGLKVITRDPLPLNEWRHVVVSYDGSRKAAGVSIYIDGKPQPIETLSDKLTGTLKTDKPFHLGKRQSSVPFIGRLDDLQIFAGVLTADDAGRLAKVEAVSRMADLLAIPADKRSAEQTAEIQRYYLDRVDADSQRWKAEQGMLPARRTAIEMAVPAVMVMEDTAKRITRLLKRGQYDQPADEVTPGVPAVLPPIAGDAPANRLGLARWLVSPSHPLTARVAVNRYWEMLFGAGLVETSEDFGITGALPTHPELLDWLAVEFVEGRGSRDGGRVTETNRGPASPSTGDPGLSTLPWDIRNLLRLIVTSATYRQASDAPANVRERDPRNQLLSRGPRQRLSAEGVRDNALAISGLLVERAGGPSVKPYQPEGLWEDVSVERRYKYVPDTGDGLYRRSMYTFWKRTCPPPALSTFDAPTRETCVIRRARTNTPLQALVLLNDPTYIEAARKLAERVMHDAADVEGRISLAFRLAIGRTPDGMERDELASLLQSARKQFEADPRAAAKLLAVGASPRDARLSETELAAWTIVSTTILNLDATVSPE